MVIGGLVGKTVFGEGVFGESFFGKSFVNEGGDFLAENSRREFFGRFANGFMVKVSRVEGLDDLGERFGGLFREKEAVLPWPAGVDEVAAAAFGVGDDRATGGESLNGGDAKRFETGEKIGFGGLEIRGEVGGFEPRDESDKRRAMSELDEILMLGTVANHKERFLGL